MIRITYEAYNEMLKRVPGKPPESGGILGGCGNIIKYVEPDNGIKKSYFKTCYYSPDVERLNQCIEEWQKKGIDFYGIYHTHFHNVGTLSEGDEAYIKKIMNAMPPEITDLNFPLIILPDRKVKNYVCIRCGENIEIKEGRMSII